VGDLPEPLAAAGHTVSLKWRRTLKTMVVALFALFLMGAHTATAQSPYATDAAACDRLTGSDLQKVCHIAFTAPPLTFPTAPEETLPLGRPPMAIYKPPGNGPFPAIILLHACAGPASHLAYWVKNAVAAGYVAFVVDSFSPRSYPVSCRPQGPVTSPLAGAIAAAGLAKPFPSPVANWFRVRDAYAALLHLSSLAFVDKQRIAAMGFSQGGRVSYLLASKQVAAIFSPSGPRFAGAVILYGECFSRQTGISNVLDDIDRPVLALLGAKDTDGDPSECVPRLQADKDRAEPVSWQIYDGVGHAWDQPEFRVAQRRPYAGSPSGYVMYFYNEDVTEQSRQAAFAFLAQVLKP
jgi:dienelactone hydrolase